jgi:hypothetical protein
MSHSKVALTESFDALISAVRVTSLHKRSRHAILHIPKTAGTTLRTILSKAFPGEVFPSEDELIANDSAYLSFAALRNQRQVIATRRFVMGHYTLSELLELFPDRDVITCMREPFARTVSVLGHYRRVYGLPVKELLTNPTFCREQVINTQLFYLATGEHSRDAWTVEYSETFLDKALQNLSRVRLVGTQERFPQFVAGIAAELQFPTLTTFGHRENTATNAFDEELAPYADQIREMIQADIELYRHVCLAAGRPQFP